jgi:hypothetical protein
MLKKTLVKTLFRYSFLILSGALMAFVFSCTKDEPAPKEAKIILNFTQFCEGQPLEYDTMKYVNAAGNHYLVNEIQYFISDVKLHRSDGTFQLIDQFEDIHYVDTDIPATQSWQVFDPIIAGNYEKVSFTFGISEAKNQSLMFVNPPERDMFWPDVLGGGYHYLKLNGKWLAAKNLVIPFKTYNFIMFLCQTPSSPDDILKPFNFHLGIGQIYSGGGMNTDSITGFVQNYFEVELPNSAFSISDGDTLQFEIRMNVENWFQNPHIWDHNYWGGMIMQNQEAMNTACENGKEDVFGFEKITK